MRARLCPQLRRQQQRCARLLPDGRRASTHAKREQHPTSCIHAPPRLPPSLQLLPGWLTTVTLSALLSFITYKMGRKAAEIWRKERAALQRLYEPLGQGPGDEWETGLRAPLLDVAAAGDGMRHGTPSPVGPLTLRPDSAGSSSDGGGGALLAEQAGAAAATAAAAIEAAAGDGEGELASYGSAPLPIGPRPGSGVLPLLTPVE
mgnify:CR=1 FL=1